MLSVFAAKNWGNQALWQSYGEMLKGYWVFFVFLIIGSALIILLAKRTIPA